MARLKTCVDVPAIIKAKLDPTEMAPALGKGQPVVVTKWPLEGSPDVMLVKMCPDGEVPDFVVGNGALSASAPGDLVSPGTPNAPILLGGSVVRRDLLVVKSGKFQKAAAKDVCACAAGIDGASGDVIPAAPLSVKA